MAEQANDGPDETEGRRLYRTRADALASAQVSMSKRRIKISTSRDPCHCKAFCLEDTDRTGRYCRILARTHGEEARPAKEGK